MCISDGQESITIKPVFVCERCKVGSSLKRPRWSDSSASWPVVQDYDDRTCAR